MGVTTRSFKTIVANATAVAQGAASALVDYSKGAIAGALTNAAAGIALWLQAVALQVLSTTRLSTSVGADVDSYLADFGFKRKGATPASGPVTFARVTSTIAATIPVGTVVQTADGSLQYAVIADAENGAFNPSLNAYTIAANTSSAIVTVQCTTAGSVGNAAEGLISVLGQSIVGVDTVSNAAAFSNGKDAETDAEARASFQSYLVNLTEGTKQACINAAEGIQEGVTCVILSNQALDGTPQAGYFAAIIDDGSGNPSDDLLSAAYAAIDAVRAEGTIFGVFRPSVVTANLTLTVTVAAGFTSGTVKAAVSAALQKFINASKLGQSLAYTRLSQVAYDAIPNSLTNVTFITLNSGTSDLTASAQQLIRSGTVTVN